MIDETLSRKGLQLQAVVDATLVADLVPSTAVESNVARFRQLLVFGSRGGDLWRQLKVRKSVSDGDESDPIDRFSVQCVEAFLARSGCHQFDVLYPSNNHEETLLDLRALGRRLGWHRDSLLGIGIHPDWGTWFAYRVVVAADTAFEATALGPTGRSPCSDCNDKPCIAACPADAVDESGGFSLERCSHYRLQTGSACQFTCLARQACPVGQQFAYGSDQRHYHYNHSLQTLRHSS